MFGDPLPEWVSFIDVIVGGITLFVLMGLALIAVEYDKKD